MKKPIREPMTFSEYAETYPARQHTCKLILNLLTDYPRSAPALASTVRLHPDYIRRLLHSMRDAGLVYVVQWERAGRSSSSPWRPIWKAGNRDSLPIPRLSDEEKAELKRVGEKRRRNQSNPPAPSRLWEDLLALAKA